MKRALLTLLAAMAIATLSAQPQHERHRRPHHHEHAPHHKPRYMIGDFEVFFGGMPVKGASAATFKVLQNGYAREAWNVYYDGVRACLYCNLRKCLL